MVFFWETSFESVVPRRIDTTTSSFVVYAMSKEIDCQGVPHSIGSCVEVSTWMHDGDDGFFVPGKAIGLVLERELVEMDGESGLFDPTKEWLYRVSLPDGQIVEAWDYEVKNVNAA